MRRRRSLGVEVVCLLGRGAQKLQSCGRGMGAEEGLPGHRYATRLKAPGELFCVQVALWLVVVVCCPAGRMRTMKEVEVEHGCELGCCLQNCVSCVVSCASAVALEPRRHLHVMAHWRRHLTCVVCMVGEVEELRNHPLVVCWKTEVVSLSWEGYGLCWA